MMAKALFGMFLIIGVPLILMTLAQLSGSLG